MGAPVYMHLSELRSFAIVIRNNPSSEFYFSKIDPVWEEIGITLERFDAITPSTMPNTLKFHRNEANKYKHLPAQSKEFTETEKACWYSHYTLWKKCIELNHPIVIVEHDCVPFNPSALYFTNKEWFRTFDKGAMGCYMMTPFMADFICRITERDGVYSGPLGHIEFWYRMFAGKTALATGERFVGPTTNRFTLGCTQIMHKKFANTIDHYGGTNAEEEYGKVFNSGRAFPFLYIDDLPELLTVDILQQQRHKYDYIDKSLNKKKSPEGL